MAVGCWGGHVWTPSGLGGTLWGGGTPPPSLYAASTPGTPCSTYASIVQELPDGHLKTRPNPLCRPPPLPGRLCSWRVLLSAPEGLTWQSSLGTVVDVCNHRPDSGTFSSPQNQAPFLLARWPVPPATSQQLSVSVDLPVPGVSCDNMGSSVSGFIRGAPLVGLHPRCSERRPFTPPQAQQSPRPMQVGRNHSVVHPVLARVCVCEILPRSPLICSRTRGGFRRPSGGWQRRRCDISARGSSGRLVSSSLGCGPSRGSTGPVVASCGTP